MIIIQNESSLFFFLFSLCMSAGWIYFMALKKKDYLCLFLQLAIMNWPDSLLLITSNEWNWSLWLQFRFWKQLGLFSFEGFSSSRLKIVVIYLIDSGKFYCSQEDYVFQLYISLNWYLSFPWIAILWSLRNPLRNAVHFHISMVKRWR